MQNTRLARHLIYNSKRWFAATQKLNKAELTVRTPYRTIFNHYPNYTRLYVWTIDGLLAIGNRSNPRVYLLPAGEMEVKGLEKGKGNNSTSDDGKFIHSGGWLFVHDDNSVEVNLVECIEKQDFSFDKITSPEGLETDSAAGKIASHLQEKAYKTMQRRR